MEEVISLARKGVLGFMEVELGEAGAAVGEGAAEGVVEGVSGEVGVPGVVDVLPVADWLGFHWHYYGVHVCLVMLRGLLCLKEHSTHSFGTIPIVPDTASFLQPHLNMS
jgi:hypothetical protein